MVHQHRLILAIVALVSQLAAQDPPAIHATVNEVALDLVVRDKKGKLVKNLTPADVEIYEDGVRQQIKSFRLVNGDAAPISPGGPEQPTAPDTPSLRPLPDVNLVCIVFHGLDSSTRKWAMAAAQEFIKTQMRPGTWVGIFNLGAQITSLLPFTTNRDALLRA